MLKVQIIVGSVDGIARQTAYKIHHTLNRNRHLVRINNEPVVEDLLSDNREKLLICSSTTENGEIPPNLHQLYNSLQQGDISLNGRHFGVITLGNSNNKHFSNAGIKLESALNTTGASRVGEICVIDTKETEDHTDTAVQWTHKWLENFR